MIFLGNQKNYKITRTGKYDKLVKLNGRGKITTIFDPKKETYTSTRDEKSLPVRENIEATYKELLAEKRLLRVDLDQFYRPVKVGFEEE
jgi:hypothetical protein